MHDNGAGIEVITTNFAVAKASIHASHIASNGAYGVRVNSVGVALVTIEDSAIDDNATTGVDVEGVASVVVGLNHNTIARNGTHDIVQGSTTIVRTFGNNALTGDGASDVSGSLSPVTAK